MRPYLILAALCLALYGRTLGHELLVWDDTSNIVDNAYLNPPSLEHLGRFWTESYWGLYIPVAYTVWWSMAQVLHPASSAWAYHLLNLLLHLANSLMVYELLRVVLTYHGPGPGQKTQKPKSSQTPKSNVAPLLGAALFVLHPLQVETVAWASGMRDLLSSAFAFGALLLFLKNKSPWVALGLMVLGLLAKPSIAIAPALAYFLIPAGERNGRRIRPLVGWAVAGLASLVITQLLQPASAVQALGPVWQRPWVAGDALAFYARKLLIPYPLSADYGWTPRWRAEFSEFWILGTAAWIALALLWRMRRRWTSAISDAAIFALGVAPVLGFVAFSFQDYSTVSDRYAYLAMLGAALAFARLFQLKGSRDRLIQGAALVWLATLLTLSLLRAPDWATNEGFFRSTLAANPRSYGALNNLAMLAHQKGDPTQTLEYARQALTLRPDMKPAQVNVENALKDLHRYPELADHYRFVLQQRPVDPYAHSNLCVVLDAVGNKGAALAECERAVALKPDLAAAHYNLARLFLELGRDPEAAPHVEWMRRNQPDFPGFRELSAKTNPKR